MKFISLGVGGTHPILRKICPGFASVAKMATNFSSFFVPFWRIPRAWQRGSPQDCNEFFVIFRSTLGRFPPVGRGDAAFAFFVRPGTKNHFGQPRTKNTFGQPQNLKSVSEINYDTGKSGTFPNQASFFACAPLE